MKFGSIMQVVTSWESEHERDGGLDMTLKAMVQEFITPTLGQSRLSAISNLSVSTNPKMRGSSYLPTKPSQVQMFPKSSMHLKRRYMMNHHH